MSNETLTRIRLGMTDLAVAPIGFGTWELGGRTGSVRRTAGNRSESLSVVPYS